MARVAFATRGRALALIRAPACRSSQIKGIEEGAILKS